MKKIYQDSTFYLVIFIVSYFIYDYPYEILNQLIFNEKASRGSSLYYTVIIGALVILYFRSKITFFPLKIFIYEGMGIGFISFWVLNIAYIISYFNLLNNYFLGILSLGKYNNHNKSIVSIFLILEHVRLTLLQFLL